MATQEREPRAYELMTVYVPELSDEDAQAQVDKVATYISNAGGSLTETLTSSPWGRRRLAYTIRFNGIDYRDGIYTVYHFDSAPSNLTELERDLKLDTSTMRYLLVHDDPKAGEKFNPDAVEEGAEGETEAASAAGGAAQASAEAATAPAEAEAAPVETPEESSEPEATAASTEAEAPSETAEAEATTESTEAESASAETAEEPAAESDASGETESSDDTTETNEDESSDKE